MMVFGKSEHVLRPHSDEVRAIFPKRMQDHVVDAVPLCRAPDHDIEPERKEVCTERGVTGAQEERAVQAEHEELACRGGLRCRGHAGKGEVGLGWNVLGRRW